MRLYCSEYLGKNFTKKRGEKRGREGGREGTYVP